MDNRPSEVISGRTRHLLGVLYVVIAAAAFLVVVGGLQRMQPDPLTVTHPGGVDLFEGRAGEKFTFWRKVCTAQNVAVTVHREFHSLATGEKYMLKSVQYVAYTEDGCYSTQFETMIPARIPPGVYEYRPILIYAVNQSKTITKPAPPVRVVVH